MTPRRIPHDIAAEEAVIGSMLLSRHAIAAARTVLRDTDFYDARLGDVYRVVLDLWQHGKPVDVGLVAAGLDAKGELARLGGRDRLGELQAQAPASANAVHYANLLTPLAAKRRLIEVGEAVTELGYDGSLDAIEAVTRARELIDRAEMPPLGGEQSPTLADLLRVMPKQPDWLVHGWLARCERLIFVALEGAGKSMLIRQLAVMLAAGIHPWGRYPIRPLRVLLIDLENPPDLVLRKMEPMEATARRLSEDYSEDRLRVEMHPEGIDVTSRADALWLEERVAVNVPDVVCIGPLYKLHDSDESDFRPVRQVQSVLDGIRMRYGVSLIMETHAPHESFKSGKLRISGSRAWMRWPEFVLALQPEQENKLNGPWAMYHARPPRDEREWPKVLQRHGHTWPWEAYEDLIPPPQEGFDL